MIYIYVTGQNKGQEGEERQDMTCHDIPIRNVATANYSILSANLPGKF